MTPEQMRVAITEKVGWKPRVIDYNCVSPDKTSYCMIGTKLECEDWIAKLPAGSRFKSYTVQPCYSDPPNYPEDLNACAQFEKDAPIEYWMKLWEITGACAMSLRSQQIALVAGATATQRCEALCRVWWPERFEK